MPAFFFKLYYAKSYSQAVPCDPSPRHFRLMRRDPGAGQPLVGLA